MAENKNNILYVLVTFSLLLLSATITGADIQSNDQTSYILTDNTPARWTVMMYLACDTGRDRLLDNYFEILTEIGSSNDVNIVGLIDSRKPGDTFFCYFEKNRVIPLSWYESESDLAEPGTFERFLDLSMYLYPADDYALFTLSDFGSGWQGIICDTNSGGGIESLSLITMPEVRGVLKKITSNGTNKIDVWGIDVCIPCMLEVAYEIAPYVDYMVANEAQGREGHYSDEGFLLDWNYIYFLQSLKDNPDMTPEQFATLIVDCYQAGTETLKIFGKITAPKWYPVVKFHTTLSAINLSKINLVNNAVNTLASNLTENLNIVKHEIKKARSQTREYGKLYRRFWWLSFGILYDLQLDPLRHDCFIDLYDFADKLKTKTNIQTIQDACDMVMESLNSTVIANEATPYDPSYGLSIYFPELRCQYDTSMWRTPFNKKFKKIPSPYKNLQFSQDNLWDEFLREYLKI